MDILTYITDFREKNWSHFFLHGGCYIFARILQTKFGGVLYDNVDHVVLNKDGLLYDITGIVQQPHGTNGPFYSLIDECVEARYRNYCNWNW